MKKILLLLLLFLNSPANETYVGEESCKECHIHEFSQWKDSHHDLAMQKATQKNVLGDFNNTLFTSKNKITSRFYKDGQKFIINTDGADGKLHNYEISYTFGVYPLQQYMVEFEDGRIQVLDIAWDSRTKEDGGQKWYHLHPHENIKAKDVLHWTGPNLNWNYMCADCHSTNLKKNYDASTHSYSTEYSSINVSCEACHGPASEHITWAKKSKKNMTTLKKYLTNDFSSLKTRQWHFDDNNSTASLSTIEPNEELQVCVKCHSRRIQYDDNFKAGDKFHNHYEPLYLDQDLYFNDGKIKDEVYVYNSFLQSKMYEAGVTCSDCHNPHSLERKGSGDNVCFKCHTTSKYQSPSHHKHKDSSTGSSCINCHMPSRMYMGIDERNDHSFRVPRPDLSVDSEIPNACNNCHKDKTALWATQNMKTWYGEIKKGKQQFSHTLSSVHKQSKEAPTLLFDTLKSSAPNIAKATLTKYLGAYQNKQAYKTILDSLKSKNIDIQLNALRALESFPLQYRIKPTLDALQNSIKSIRLEAARQLSPLINDDLVPHQKEILQSAINEYEESLLFNAERPESQSALALLYLNLNQNTKAERAFKEAIHLQEKFIPAYVNYASFLSHVNREKEAFNILNDGLKLSPKSGVLHQALGLWYIRSSDSKKALSELKEAALLEPQNINIQYTYAISIAPKNLDKAIKILKNLLDKHSGEVSVINALIHYYKQKGDSINALLLEQRLKDFML